MRTLLLSTLAVVALAVSSPAQAQEGFNQFIADFAREAGTRNIAVPPINALQAAFIAQAPTGFVALAGIVVPVAAGVAGTGAVIAAAGAGGGGGPVNTQ